MKIVLSNLELHYGQTRVLGPLNFSDQFQSLAIIGPSGSGKSTLIKILAGLLPPTEGQVFLNDMTLPTAEADRIAYRRRLGFVFQHGGLFSHLSALENIVLPLTQVHRKSQADATDIAMNLLNRLGLANHHNKRPRELSGGQLQRVSIARAIAPKPEVLLLDEPTSALDPEYTTEVLDTLMQLQAEENLPMIIVTHEMGFARHACQKILFLSEGLPKAFGDSAHFFSNSENPEVQRFLKGILHWKI